MERRLVVMRHAKSSWSSGAPTDHARPLNKRGRRDAPKVGEFLATTGWAPDLVLSSDSLRTRETWECLEPTLGAVDPIFLGTLYHAGIDALRREIPDRATDAHQTVLVLGHNPGWENAVNWLTGRPTRLKTADAALLVGEGPTWAEALAEPMGWTMARFVRSRAL